MTTEKITDLEKKVDRLLEHSETQKKSMEKIHQFLFGNGSVGLDERVRTLETWSCITSKMLWVVITAFLADLTRRMLI